MTEATCSVSSAEGNEVDLSLVVTTYNRVDQLERALASLARLERPAALRAEILVVDNNSNDGTATQLRAISAAWVGIPLRHTVELHQGVSHARNRAMAEARGLWVAYMDDDQEAAPDYLVEFSRAATHLAAADCIGGKILYRHEGELPPWLPPLIETVGQIDLGEHPLRLDHPDQLLKGGNIAFRLDRLRALGGFDPRLGRVANSLLAGEEDELQHRLRAAGGAVWYWPGLVQFNGLPPAKLEKTYWRRHALGYGETQRLRSGERRQWPPWLLTRLAAASTRWIYSKLTRSSDAFRRELDLLEVWGALRQPESNKPNQST